MQTPASVLDKMYKFLRPTVVWVLARDTTNVTAKPSRPRWSRLVGHESLNSPDARHPVEQAFRPHLLDVAPGLHPAMQPATWHRRMAWNQLNSSSCLKHLYGGLRGNCRRQCHRQRVCRPGSVAVSGALWAVPAASKAGCAEASANRGLWRPDDWPSRRQQQASRLCVTAGSSGVALELRACYHPFDSRYCGSRRRRVDVETKSSVSHVHPSFHLIELLHCLADDGGADILDTAAYAAQYAPPHSAPLRAC